MDRRILDANMIDRVFCDCNSNTADCGDLALAFETLKKYEHDKVFKNILSKMHRGNTYREMWQCFSNYC